MKIKTILSTILLTLFLINFVSANPEADIPTSIALKCSETYSRSFNFGEQINLTVGIMTSTDTIGYIMGATPTTANQVLYLSFFPESNYVCHAGKSKFTFKANNENYEIWVNVTEDLWELDVITLREGETLNVGGVADFKVSTSGETNAMFTLEGCDEDIEDFLEVGNFIDATCDGEVIRFWLEDSFPDLGAVKIKVFSSESGFTLTKDGQTNNYGDSECVLGLDTMGALVKRGNVFAIKTINVVENKRVPNVLVTILDQEGELSFIEGTSSNTGLFSKRLHEEYGQDLIVELEKEGCEPSTQIILFQQSYNDYLQDKESEERQTTLIINQLEENYNFGSDIVLTVTNLVNESIEKAKVKITNPSGVSVEVETNSLGQFTFTPTENGIHKIQVSKYDYITSELLETNIKSAEYTIKMIRGEEEVFDGFKINDIIHFEMIDDNDTIIPLTFEGEYNDNPISFLDGISEEVKFIGMTDLVIPAIGGFEENDFKVKKKDSNLMKWIYFGGGSLLLILIIIFIVNKSGKGGSVPKTENKMSFKLPRGEA